jgi:hypothetical protein
MIEKPLYPVVGLVVPTGYSFNLDGTNIYMTMAALFIAQATDLHLLEQRGQRRLGGRGAEHQEQFLLDVADQLDDREASTSTAPTST